MCGRFSWAQGHDQASDGVSDIVRARSGSGIANGSGMRSHTTYTTYSHTTVLIHCNPTLALALVLALAQALGLALDC